MRRLGRRKGFAMASLLAGTVMYYFGRASLMWVPIPVLIVICIVRALVRNDPMLI